MKLTGRKVDISDFDRISAVIVADGKVYVSDCDHQEAFEMLCEDIGKTSGLDWSNPDNFDEVHEKAVEMTNQKFLNDEIQGFSVFLGEENNMYMIAHYPENLESAYAEINEYIKKCGGMKLGTFVDRSNVAVLVA